MRKRGSLKLLLPVVAALLAASACYGENLDGTGLALFFAGAMLAMWLWLRALQRTPRAPRTALTNRPSR
ncbi:MAG: hypothetical protein ACM3PU_06685 [Gemmatimonadota bacterium]